MRAMTAMRRDINERVLTCLGMVLLMTGCTLAEPVGHAVAEKSGATQPAAPANAAVSCATQPTSQPADSIVLVRLGDRAVVTQADVDKALIKEWPERFERVKEGVVNALVDERIWDLYLADHPELVKEEDVERQIEYQLTRLRFKSIQELEKRLRERDRITLEEHRQRTRRKLLVGRLIQDGLNKGKEESALKAIYDANPDHFNSTLVSARQIILRSPCWETPQQRAEKKQKLNKMRADLISGSRTWDQCMAESGTKLPDGGRINSFKRYEMGEIGEELAKAAFSLKPGEYSEVVETPLGFHLLQLRDRKQGTNTLPKPQVKSQILKYLQTEAVLEARASVLAKAPIIGVQPPSMPEFMRQILATRPAPTTQPETTTQPMASKPASATAKP